MASAPEGRDQRSPEVVARPRGSSLVRPCGILLPMPINPLAKVRRVAFEGGGVLGMAYLPVLQALDAAGAQVDDHAGTSAGAITAMLRALRLSSSAIGDLVRSTPWDRFASYRVGALYRLLRRGGWYPIDYPRQWLRDALEDARFPVELDFGTLRRVHGQTLRVVATRYSRRPGGAIEASPFVFDPLATPSVPVVDAVLASMAIPGFYPPVEVAGWWHADGGVAMNHPLSLYEAEPAEEILGVRVDTPIEIEGRDGDPARPGLLAVLRANVGMLRTLANRQYVPEELWRRVIRIPVTDRATNFRGGEVMADRLMDAGRKAVAEWLEKQVDVE